MSPTKQRLLISGLILAGILIVGFFGLRAFHAFREYRRHGPPPRFAPAEAQEAETDVELIRDWMTIPYIAMTYHVHPKILFDALEINPKGNDEKNLSQLNEEFFPDNPGIVIEIIKAATLANQTVPTPLIPDSPTPPVVP